MRSNLLPRSLSSRIFALYGLTLFVSFFVGVTLFLRFQFTQQIEDTQLVAVTFIEVAAQAVQDSAVIGDYDTVKKTLDRSVQASLFSRATFIGVEGDRIDATDAQRRIGKAPDWLKEWTAQQFSDVNHIIAVGGKDYGVLRLHFDTPFLAGQLWSLAVLASALAYSSLAIGLILIRLALKRWLGGLDQLQAFGAALGTGNLDVGRLKLDDAPSEIVQVVDMFNKTATLVREREVTRHALDNQKFALDQHAIVSMTDLAGNITYANDKFCEISGYRRDELLGKNHRIIGSGIQDRQFFVDLWDTIVSGNVWRGEICDQSKDGSLYWVVSTIVPLLNAAGAPEQYIAIRTDVSERKRIELEKAQLLEQFKIQAQDLEVKSIALEEASRREMEIGNRIQQTLLVTPPAPRYHGLLVSAFSQASKGIDGDFFDVFKFGQHAIDVVVGDVMGKGVPAALLGAATKLQFSRSMAELLMESSQMGDLPQPRDIVSLVNRTMAPHLQALDAFVTLTYLRIDVKANTLTWLGCGHEESLRISSDGSITPLGNQHPPIGLFLDESYTQDVCELLPGDSVFLCSDGVSDAILKTGERLGHSLLRETVGRHTAAHATPAMVLHALRRDLLLDQDVKVVDDLTMVMLTRYDLQRNVARLEVPISIDSLRAVREFVERHVCELPEHISGPLTVAAVEVMTNVLRHAANLVPGAPMELLIERAGNGMQIDFTYLAAPFTLPVDPPPIDYASFPEGGFGLHIIHKSVDRVHFLHSGGVNTIRFWIDSASVSASAG